MGTGLLVKAVTLGDPGQVGQRLCNSIAAATAWDQLAASPPRLPSPSLGIWCVAPERKPFPEVLVSGMSLLQQHLQIPTGCEEASDRRADGGAGWS